MKNNHQETLQNKQDIFDKTITVLTELKKAAEANEIVTWESYMDADHTAAISSSTFNKKDTRVIEEIIEMVGAKLNISGFGAFAEEAETNGKKDPEKQNIRIDIMGYAEAKESSAKEYQKIPFNSLIEDVKQLRTHLQSPETWKENDDGSVSIRVFDGNDIWHKKTNRVSYLLKSATEEWKNITIEDTLLNSQEFSNLKDSITNKLEKVKSEFEKVKEAGSTEELQDMLKNTLEKALSTTHGEVVSTRAHNITVPKEAVEKLSDSLGINVNGRQPS